MPDPCTLGVMRIVLVNWARIQDGASHGGGVNGYCQAVALELSARGHQVTSLSSGTVFEPAGNSIGPVSIRRRPDWRGIQIQEVINSPVLAPSMAQFKDPSGEVSAPLLERELSRLLTELRPDVVHFHNLEGLSAGCIQTARGSGARVVYSLHNYHTVCPQVYFMQGHRRACHGFENGHACAACIPGVNPQEERLRLAGLLPALPPTPPIPPTPPRLPRPPWETIDLPAWRPLLNIIQPEPPSTHPPNAYAARRSAMVRALNTCDRVLAVSDFVKRKFESLGLDPRIVRTQHIGCRMPELVDHSLTTSAPSFDTGRPIRLAFVGYNNWFKGLPMLADSLELLTPEVLSRFSLTVLALNGEYMEPQLRRLEPRLAGLTLRHGYAYEELPRLLAETDLGLVVSTWWDNAPQTVMEFLACGIPVLGADLGGIPEFIQDEQNGLLFRGNDRWDLARRLAEVARQPRKLAQLRAGVRPPKTMGTHVTELEQEYRNRLS